MSANALSIVVVGGSGDLARRKIYPALFALYCQGYLPAEFQVFGFARREFTAEAFRQSVAERLTCRYVPGEACAERMAEFVARCHYCRGQYDARDSFLDLYQRMRALERSPEASRLFYMAIPPSVFLDVARAMAGAGLVNCGAGEPWSRVVVEKPFGYDRPSSDRLTRELAQVFDEDQTYRIDHYLGKELIQNLMVLRFANRVFEPLWSREHIQAVHIDWKETDGVGARGGYFDASGIIRDVVQNHLTQVLALVAMERPADGQATAIRNEKIRVLRAVKPLRLERLILGQYRSTARDDIRLPAYTEEPSVPPDSRTPTYAAAFLQIDNDRWRGVPFLITAGKAMDASLSEVRIHFRDQTAGIFSTDSGRLAANQLVIRIQPDEDLYLQIVNKEPGLAMKLVETRLDLRYKSVFAQPIPDAYECLLLDVIRGDRSLFISADELAASWDLYTPVLHRIDSERTIPEPYDSGSAGPAHAAARLDSWMSGTHVSDA